MYEVFKANDICSDLFLFLFLKSKQFNNYVNRFAEGGVRQYLFYENFCRIPTNLPTMAEQQKIAAFLILLDERIAKQRELVESLKSYKRGALSAVFSGKICFKDNEGNEFPEWRKSNIGTVFTERNERAKGNEELLAVTINSGIIKRDEIELKDNSSDDKINYKRVYVNDIAYNTMRMWQGSSGVSSYNGIVSPAYTVIYSTDFENTDVRFWGYYFKTYKLVCEFQRFSQGLTSDTWNLKYPQLSEIEVRVPCIEEQHLIANFLDSLNEAILKHERYLDLLSLQRNEILRMMFI